MDWQSIQPLFHWLAENPAWSGLIIFLIALTESLFIVGLLVPGTILMFGVGTLVGTGVLGIQSTLIFAFLGAVTGDGISFWIGRRYHRQFSNIWPIKNNPHYLDRGIAYFEKHGGKSILFGRFIGPIRPVIPAVAGMMGMSVPYFFFINVLSAVAWAPFYLLPGIVFGSSIGLASTVGVRLMVLLVALLICSIAFIWLARKFVNHIVLRVMSFRRFMLLMTGAFIIITGLLISVITGQQNIEDVPIIEISRESWLADEYRKLPRAREDFLGIKQQTLNVQWAGGINTIEHDLLSSGWQKPIPLDYKSALYWLKPDVSLIELPFFSLTHRGAKNALMLIRYDADLSEAIVLRLWPSTRKIQETNFLIWVGSIARWELDVKAKWLPYLKSTPLSVTAAEQALLVQGIKASREEAQPMLLIGDFDDEK